LPPLATLKLSGRCGRCRRVGRRTDAIIAAHRHQHAQAWHGHHRLHAGRSRVTVCALGLSPSHRRRESSRHSHGPLWSATEVPLGGDGSTHRWAHAPMKGSTGSPSGCRTSLIAHPISSKPSLQHCEEKARRRKWLGFQERRAQQVLSAQNCRATVRSD
jgi:hypothetical protein